MAGTVRDTQDAYALIKRWRLSAKRTEQVAADLALKIRTGQLHRWAELPSQAALAEQYDVAEGTITSVSACSPSTAS